jgi:TRAP transporter TAXI family solute receptor
MTRKLVASLALALAIAPGMAVAQNMVLATGGTAGTYYPFGGAMARIWNSKIKGMNVTAQATGASAENVRLVNQGEAELAIVQSDTVDFAFNGTESFKKPLKEMAALAVLYPEVVQVVVRADSPVKTFADLKGKKVGVGAPGSGTEANFRQLLDVYGLKKEDVNAQFLSFSESAEQFKDNNIDAFVVTAGIPNAAILDIATQGQGVKILSIADDKAGQLTKKYPFLTQLAIPANTYKGQTAEVKTVAVNAVLIGKKDLKDGVAYDLVRSLFEGQAELAQAHAKGKELTLKSAATGVSIPFHPGAQKFFREKGVAK